MHHCGKLPIAIGVSHQKQTNQAFRSLLKNLAPAGLISIREGMFKPRRKKPEQKEFWVVAARLPKASPSRFYELLNGTLEEMDFAGEVQALCAPADADEARGGRPGIDPVTYFKTLMIGFFEGLESERAHRRAVRRLAFPARLSGLPARPRPRRIIPT